ncbi:MAG: class I SAM-dependent methyltransferase [Candidatus Omnitrophica bacterium]|nr:class I SAM-dependent methyltransferase [Candidatus Omnitrophota bacterium]
MELIKIACPLCGSQSGDFVFSASDNRLNTTKEKFKFVRCPGCAMVFINPQPQESALHQFYPVNYHSPFSLGLESFYSPIVRKNLRTIVKDLKKIRKNGRVLDVGCGNGALLNELVKGGFDAYGIDTYPGVREVVPAELKARVKEANFYSSGYPDKEFDIIILKQALEHFSDQNRAIMAISRLLKDTGIVYIEVPNFACSESRLFKQFWYNLEAPRHLYQYTPRTLRYIFEQNGFKLRSQLPHKGVLNLKSPLAVFGSLNFFLENKMPGRRLLLKISESAFLLPSLMAAFFMRFLIDREGMDIRMIFEKNTPDKTVKRK